MTELVIAAVLVGSAYLISNKPKNTEPFEEGIDKQNIKQTFAIKNNISQSSLNMKPEKLRTTMDKYTEPSKQATMTHNNMTHFYNSNSYGHTNDKYNNDSKIDQYTGAGSQSISKKETATLFKPQDHLHNVYGSQNQNDFLQSRVNDSNRHANSKPWEEIKEGPGDMGFNSSMQYRDKTIPKSVDELRTSNNPKSVYQNNYKSPAYEPNHYNPTQADTLGKVIKKTQDTYFVNEGVGGVGPAHGLVKPSQTPLQMMTNENRDTTSVQYYGAKGGKNTAISTNSEHAESKKQQLPANPFSNLTSQHIFPSSQNYGKDGFKLLDNNRSIKQEDYFGNVKGQFMSNVVNPIVNQLKHTKKSNHIQNPNPSGNLGGASKQPIVYNPYDKAPTTNRQMTTESINHLNYQGQSKNLYINKNPYISNSQRQSTSHSILGNAGGTDANKSYEAEYNQRNSDKPYDNRTSGGNISLYNGNINASINGHEKYNTRSNSLYAPTNDTPNNNQRGAITKQTQKYESSNTMDTSILKAFKENPYTHSLSSIA